MVIPAASQPMLAMVTGAAEGGASQVLLKSFNSEGVNFFNSMRTPAALVAAVHEAMGTMTC